MLLAGGVRSSDPELRTCRTRESNRPGREAAENHISVAREAGGPFVTAADRTRMPMLFTDPNLPGNPIIYANDSFLSMSGYGREEVLGKDCYFMMGPETDPDARAQIDASFSAGFYDGHPEVRYYHKDGSSFWAIIFQGPALDAGGNVTHHFVSFIDVTGRRREERHLRLLLSELNHRTQNILATVQAIALQTLHDKADGNAVEAFEDRILALSAAHRLLGSANWEGADMREVISAILVPFGFNDGQVDRFSITGEDVFLPPKTALTFAMVFQELATNAAKYGALLEYCRPCRYLLAGRAGRAGRTPAAALGRKRRTAREPARITRASGLN